MNVEVKKRLGWIRVYEGNGNFWMTCLRCGISRPALRKWWRRYESAGVEGLQSRSRRPRRMPFRKVFLSQTKKIHRLRQPSGGTNVRQTLASLASRSLQVISDISLLGFEFFPFAPTLCQRATGCNRLLQSTVLESKSTGNDSNFSPSAPNPPVRLNGNNFPSKKNLLLINKSLSLLAFSLKTGQFKSSVFLF